MSNLVVFAEEKNAAAFKDLFEQTVAEKVMAALAERKKHVAEKLSAEISKQIHDNPAAKNKSDLQTFEPGTKKPSTKNDRVHWGISSSPHPGGFTAEGARTDVEGLNPDELDKSPGMGGGFTNEKPLSKVWLKPHIPAGQSKLPFTKETAKGK
jgi:hypothetical protein